MSILSNIRQWTIVQKCRESRKFLILIVYIALFLDNMLLTTVVPIIPEYLYRLKHPNDSSFNAIYSHPTPEAPPEAARPEDNGERPRNIYEPRDDGLPFNAVPSAVQAAIGLNASAAQAHRNSRMRERRKMVHERLKRENVEVGVMFGSKALVQIVTNPFVGPLTTRIGYTVPMFSGFVVMFVSTIIFAAGNTYAMLFIARMLQGVGSACTSTSGMGMIAERYPDDQERGAAMGVALGGLALGVLVGPPYGGLLYEYAGKALPFVLLSLLALLDGTLQFIVLQPRVVPGPEKATTIKELIKDPYILICVGAITIGNLGIAMLEPTLPIWMMEKMQATSATRGAAFLPASISYLIGTNIFGPLAHKIGRWLSALIGLVVISASLMSIPSATGVSGLILPNGCLGLAIGMIDASMFPQMGYLVDLRHDGIYGSIYAIADAAFCLAFALGPFFGTPIARALGFPATMYIISAVTLIYAPFMFFLRNPPQIERETQQLLPDSGEASRYERFGDEPEIMADQDY